MEKQLLLTTFDSIVMLILDRELRVEKTKLIESGVGIYFGISRSSDTTYIVSRNIDINGNILQSGRPTNSILACEVDSAMTVRDVLTDSNFTDLHQIRVYGSYLFVLSTSSPSLQIYDRLNWTLMSQIDLCPMIPCDLQHAAPPEHPSDPYHFNSLTFCDGHLYVLAHNWGFGSFAPLPNVGSPETRVFGL